jgi:hypothetical protein
MILSVMQPYFFPHLGYYEQVSQSDEFVLFDDVNFIKGGWINRNFLTLDGQQKLFTIPLKNQSQNRLINEHEIFRGPELVKFIKSIERTYSKCKHFDVGYSILTEALEEVLISKACEKSISLVADYLGITTKITNSSDLAYDRHGKGQDKILSICSIKAPSVYLNATGGRHLYEASNFGEIQLRFMPPTKPGLSIIDLLMRYDGEEIFKKMSTIAI